MVAHKDVHSPRRVNATFWSPAYHVSVLTVTATIAATRYSTLALTNLVSCTLLIRVSRGSGPVRPVCAFYTSKFRKFNHLVSALLNCLLGCVITAGQTLRV